ncbi:unnamed protein product [Lota lota]
MLVVSEASGASVGGEVCLWWLLLGALTVTPHYSRKPGHPSSKIFQTEELVTLGRALLKTRPYSSFNQSAA